MKVKFAFHLNEGPRVCRKSGEEQNPHCLKTSMKSVVFYGVDVLPPCCFMPLNRDANFLFQQDLVLAHPGKCTISLTMALLCFIG